MQRHCYANKSPSSQNYGVFSSNIWMWELDYKETWALKNWCFWTMVLEKTLESPLDYMEIQPVHLKGNQSWIFVGRTDAQAEAPIFWSHDAKNWLILKDPDAVKDWRHEQDRYPRPWRAEVHGVTKSQTWLTNWTELSWCNLVLYSIRLTLITSHILYLGVVFSLIHHFILSGAISLLLSSSILRTYWPEVFKFQFHIFLTFHIVRGILKERMLLMWFAILFFSGLCFVRTFHHDLSICVALKGMAHSFVELDKAEVHVITFISCVWLWFSFCLPSDE